MNKAHEQYNEETLRLRILHGQRAVAEARLRDARRITTIFPGLSALATTINANCVVLQHRFVPIKEVIAKLSLAAGWLKEYVAGAHTKERFAVGLLEICRDSLLDRELMDEALMVKDEIMNEYGAADVPEDVKKVAVEVSERLGQIAGVASIRA